MTWPEAAIELQDTQNAHYETIKTYHETTFSGFGTMHYTNQFYLTACQVQADNSELRYWVIGCDVSVMVVTLGEVCTFAGCFIPAPEYESAGTAQYRLWWDSGTVEEL